MSQSQSRSGATIDNLIAQMSRGASVLNGWDAVLNIDENVVNQIFQAQFKQAAQAAWKNITIAFCQTFPNPSGGGKLAVYTGVKITLATPSLTFLGNNQAFVEVSFKATGRTGTASKPVPAGFDPKKDADLDDPSLDWTYTSFSNTDFTGKVPLSAVTGSARTSGEATEFVIDFPSGSFTSPIFGQVKDPNELHLQLKNYLQTHDVQYVINSIETDLLNQIPQMAPKAFRIAVLTTNEKKNVFQTFIATQNPVQRNLTIGVNEPIPDGYSLSVMFNKNIVGQLKTSLMVQAWLFMESNLTFPGRTALSLGPKFTPDDALILGTLEVDMSPSITPVEPHNGHSHEEQSMLNIQKTKQITPPGQPAFTAYGDDDPNSNAWYIPPKVIWAKNSTTQLPQFSLVKYNSTGGGVSGFCRFSVQLMIDPAQEAALKKTVPGATTPQFDWVQSGAVFTYTIDGKSTSVHSQPSNFGSQTVTFSVPLADEKAIAAFVNAFSPSGSGGGTFGVSYDLAANTRLPAVTAVTTFNSTLAYQYQVENKYRTETRYHTDTWGHRSSSQVQVFVGTYVKEMLQQSQAGTVEVTPGKGLTPTLLTMVEDWAAIQLQKDVEQAVNTALDLIKNPTNDFSMNSVASFTHTLKTSNVVPWYFTVDGTLSAFDDSTWSQVYSEVSQQQLEVTFDVQEDLAKLGVERINLQFKYGDPPPKTFTFDADNLSWHLSLPGQFEGSKFSAGYEYQYDVVYAAPEEGGSPPPTLSTDWISDDSTSVKFNAAQLGLMPVTFEAANIAWEAQEATQSAQEVKEITVDWNWIPGGGGPVLVDSLVLNKANPSVTRTLRSAGPTNNQQYQYSLTFLMGDDTKRHANGLTGTSPLQRISDPLADVWFYVFPSFLTTPRAVILRATFDDEVNDIHLNKQWMVQAKSEGGGTPMLSMDSFTPWEFKAVVANQNTTSVVFSGMWVDENNKQNAIPKTLIVGSNSTLFVSDTQKTVTATIDASNVTFAAPKTDGVFRVVAMVANTVSDGGAADAGSDPLANAKTISFGQRDSSIQYCPTDPIDITATPTFHYQYIYTQNIDNGAKTKVSDAWAVPQSTVSTQLPVVPGTPPETPQVRVAAAPAAVDALKAAFPADASLHPHTRVLFARHDGYCQGCDEHSQLIPTVPSSGA